MNRDRLSMVNPRETVQAAYAALSGAQDYPAEQQVMGYAVLFLEACEVLQLDVSQMLSASQRVIRDARDHYSRELWPLRTYLNNELKNA